MSDQPMPIDEAIEHWKGGMSDRQKVETLRKALEFYRDHWDWGNTGKNYCGLVPSAELLDDRGENARAALNATDA